MRGATGGEQQCSAVLGWGSCQWLIQLESDVGALSWYSYLQRARGEATFTTGGGRHLQLAPISGHCSLLPAGDAPLVDRLLWSAAVFWAALRWGPGLPPSCHPYVIALMRGANYSWNLTQVPWTNARCSAVSAHRVAATEALTASSMQVHLVHLISH